MVVRKPQSWKNPLAMLLAFVVMLTSLAGQARAQQLPDVLDQAAADSEIIFVVPNLAATSKKITQFVEALGFKDIQELANPLATLKKEIGIDKGLDENGAMVITISGIVNAVQQGQEPAMAVLVPVSDYKAFVGNFQGKEENGLTVLTMPHGDSGFAKKVGNYCLMGPTAEVIANYKGGGAKAALAKSAGMLGVKQLASNDISIYINMKALGAQLRPMLKEVYDEAKRELGNFDGGGPEAKMMDLAKGVIGVYFDTIDAMLRDGDAVVFGADMSTKGVGFTMNAQFREGSPLAKMFPGGMGDAASMMAKLPNNPYLMAMAFDMNGIDFQGMLDEFSKRFPQDNWLADIIKTATPTIPLTKKMASVYYAPANAASLVGGMSSVSVIETTNGAAYGKATKDYFAGMSKIKMDLGEVDGTKLNFGFTTTFKENALSPEAAANVGAKVDEYVVKLDMPKELMEQIGDAGNMVNMMLRQTGYIATVDKTVMMTTTVDTNLLKVGVEAMKQNNGLGATNLIKQVRENGLPANANYEAYINVGSLAALFNQFSALAQMFQADIPEIPQIEVPNNLPPLAMGGQVEAGGMSARFYVPMPVINWVKDIAMKFQAGEDGAAPPREPGAKPAPF